MVGVGVEEMVELVEVLAPRSLWLWIKVGIIYGDH